MPDSALFFFVILDLIENLNPRLASVLWTIASLKSQMLGSVLSMQAWLRLSPYAFVV